MYIKYIFYKEQVTILQNIFIEKNTIINRDKNKKKPAKPRGSNNNKIADRVLLFTIRVAVFLFRVCSIDGIKEKKVKTLINFIILLLGVY